MTPHRFWYAVDSCLNAFLLLGPLWLSLYLALACYANDYKYCRLTLMGYQETDIGFDEPIVAANWYLGLCMILLSATLKVNWFCPWLSIFVTSWLFDRHWTPPKNPSMKRIMQADSSLWADALLGGRLVYEEGRRPRKCPFGCRFDLSDRAYHCSKVHRCLPVYDHFCGYLWSTVYLRTMKPYCFVLVFLPLDAVYSLAVSVVALSQPSTRWSAPFVGSIILCCVVVTMVVMNNALPNLKRLVWKNTVGPELFNEIWTLAFKCQERVGWRLRLHDFETNPWDLGFRANFRQVFGEHWWMWPFFWWNPERVSRYGNYIDRDLPFADFVTAEFTNQIMPLTGVAIDPPAPSSIHGEGPSRRQLARSSADHRSQLHSNGVPTFHVGTSARFQRGARRRTEGHSSSLD
ncbi:hypothetical protein F4818DRAFT_458006 [Hypoxylon cercidicola]|nr:hypothetical protein F4818DRAFT_458006 [Hypoxylon cercidicola]